MADYNSSLPVRTENNGDVAIKVVDSTITSQGLTVNADGSVNITDNGQSLTVDATNLDIRDLAFATDKVDVSGSSVTVAATDLDIRNLNSAQDNVAVLQASHDSLNANANIQVNNTDVSNLNPVPMSDAGGSITVDGSVTVSATDLDIRDLTHVSDSVKIGNGTDFLAIEPDGSINVNVQDSMGTERVEFNTAASVAGGASSNHDETFTNASMLFQVFASASGKLKVEVQIETGAATNTFNTIAVAFNSTANPNIDITLAKYATVAAGARIRVIRTNRDNQAQDVYSTIAAVEAP